MFIGENRAFPVTDAQHERNEVGDTPSRFPSLLPPNVKSIRLFTTQVLAVSKMKINEARSGNRVSRCEVMFCRVRFFLLSLSLFFCSSRLEIPAGIAAILSAKYHVRNDHVSLFRGI